MAKPFSDLWNQMEPKRRERVDARVQATLEEMELRELRRAQQLTQQQLAEMLNMNQAAVSKIERQSDMYVSTLRRFLSAMGGELKIVASFADRDIEITQFALTKEDQQRLQSAISAD